MADAASTKRSGRPRVRTVVLLLVLGWLIGRGLGWIGSGGAASDAESAVERPVPAADAPAADDAPGAASAAAGAVKPATQPQSTDAALAALAAATPLVETVPPPPDPRPLPGFDADRFASMLSLVTQATEQRQFGDALASLQHLRSLPLDAAQQAALVPAAAALQDTVSHACGALAQRLLQGQLLAAHRELAQLVADGPLLIVAAQQALQLAGLEVGVGRDRRRGDVVLPIPTPLPRGRAVRCLRDGVLVDGRVVDSRSDAVTVRLASARGVTFPTLPVVLCEPIDASASEAVEMGFAALQHDEVLLARLWLAVALRSGSGAAARAQSLQALLP